MTKQQIRRSMISRLCNSARGHAQLVLLDKKMSDEQRKAEFEVIDEFVEYIRNYEENTKWKELYTDDGR